jgi:hypothetical protein
METDVTHKKWRAVFLDRLMQSPNISAACRRARISRKTAYTERKTDPEFAAAWAEAKEFGIDALEDTAVERARKESDTLMIFLLKAHRPERYNLPTKTQISGDKENPLEMNAHVSDAGLVSELTALLNMLSQRTLGDGSS